MKLSAKMARLGTETAFKVLAACRWLGTLDLLLSLVTLLHQHSAKQEAKQILLGKPLTDNDFVFIRPDVGPLNPNTVTHTFA